MGKFCSTRAERMKVYTVIYRCLGENFINIFFEFEKMVLDYKFLQGHLWHSPDLYLDEMQDLLESHIGVEADDSTIWRALRRSSFTMKKVNLDCH
jgi:hypothetical protein